MLTMAALRAAVLKITGHANSARGLSAARLPSPSDAYSKNLLPIFPKSAPITINNRITMPNYPIAPIAVTYLQVRPSIIRSGHILHISSGLTLMLAWRWSWDPIF